MPEAEIQGEFEHHVLLATLRLDGRAFTSSLVVELEERTGKETSPSAVYVALRRLEDKGFVQSELRTDDDEGHLRERRFFEATDEGIEALRRSRARLARLWEDLEGVLSGAEL